MSATHVAASNVRGGRSPAAASGSWVAAWTTSLARAWAHSTGAAPSALDDAALVRRAQGGDERAFAELVRRHQGRVRGLLLRLAGNAAIADDLAQETFLRAYRGFAAFEGRASLSTWLYRIAYNAYLNHRTRGRRFSPLPETFEGHAPAPEDERSPQRVDARRDVHAAIVQLPERYRAVVTLHYLQDVSYPEIAEILDLPLGTVKTHLHRAKRLLRAELLAWDPNAADAGAAGESGLDAEAEG